MYFVFLFLFLGHAIFSMQNLSFPRTGMEPTPPQWKCRVPTTGPPGKSLECILKNKNGGRNLLKFFMFKEIGYVYYVSVL